MKTEILLQNTHNVAYNSQLHYAYIMFLAILFNTTDTKYRELGMLERKLI